MHLPQLIFFSIIFFIGLIGMSYAQEPTQEIVIISQNSYNPGCELTDSCFNPTVLHITKGDSVKWINGMKAVGSSYDAICSRLYKLNAGR